MGTAIVIYGPPASGKDTVTTALSKFGNEFRHYQRIKVGAGRTTGYRMASVAELDHLIATGNVIYSNSRYGSTYAIDRPELTRGIAAGEIPVLHVGQPEAIDALLTALPTIRWVIVELWCPRDVAAERVVARATGDTDDRLKAWDATPRLDVADLRIDTATVDPTEAVDRITQAVRIAQSSIVVPAMHLVRPDGAVDFAATRRHAAAAAAGWVDFVLINGSTTAGGELTPAERTAVLDIWLEVADPSRLLACSWTASDISAAADRGVTPMAVLRTNSHPTAEEFLQTLPTRSTIYSHPMFGDTFDARVAAWAKHAGCLPAGGKLAKINPTEIAEIHTAAPEFEIWDGSSRHIRDSVAAGAAGVVATPLAGRLTELPSRSVALIQSDIDKTQVELDKLPDRAAKREWLLRHVSA